MPLYDLTMILDAEAPDARRAEILDGVRATVQADGAIVGDYDWGVRRLAFEIDRHGDGEYHLLQIDAAPPLLERLDRTLKITDEILRFRFIRLKSDAPPPTPPRPEGARRGEEERSEAPSPVAARAAADAPARE
ncbi:MAG: 30S ribosomal protein S6 [Thermoleophilaceae bacterium]|jgi:small subunit ribosomal protein S6|nr:30S ribosomal protein S6 [Thermoleophilaceae bacterium]